MIFALVSLCFGAVLQFQYADCIYCYTCTDVSSVADCTQVVTCPDGSSCFKETSYRGSYEIFNLGCKNTANCLYQNGGSLVGRSVSAVSSNCSDCCHSSHCNKQLCQDNDPSCVDTAGYGCDSLGSSVDICGDTNIAQTNCRRYCGLCHIVDGRWSPWSSWSSCGVSCGDGTQTKTRSCTNPVPVNGGNNCVGANHETQTCNAGLCPVNGGWSQWSPWGGCSSTCDIGMQRRDRSCTNPYPSQNGQHCFGGTREDRLCFPGACADGGWSGWEMWSGCSRSCGDGLRTRARRCDNPVRSITGRECPGDSSQTEMCIVASCHDGGWSQWGSWSSCSHSCGSGIHTRSRSCDNPIPSVTGRYCVGDPIQTVVCNVQSCPDGSWSHWGSWSSCSHSCGSGIHTRSRSCDNPAPSVTGRYCAGDPVQAVACNTQRCPVKLSAFTAKGPAGNGSPLVFKQMTINEGNNYSPLTGLFACQYPGLYYFAVDLTKKRDYSNQVDLIDYNIQKNGNTVSHMRIDPFDGDVDKGSYEASGSVVLHLVKGDVVSILGNSADHLESWSSFSGFLFFPDA